ncbi:MAG: SPASM domain-containing protein [Planctomycetota bacterium]
MTTVTTQETTVPVRDYSPEELEELKKQNEDIARQEWRTRPDVMKAWPQYLTIMNTYKCDLECPMCFKQLDDVFNMSLPDMEWQIFEKAAHECFPHLRFINLSVSGEPLISRNIFRELELMRKYRVKTDITTNGMPLARRGLLEALLPACHALTVSFDAGTKQSFEYIRKGAHFDTVVKNLKLFNDMRQKLAPEERPTFRMNHVYQHGNAKELVVLVELAHSIGIDHVNVEHVYVHRDYQETTSMLNHRRLANDMFERAKERAQQLNIKVKFAPMYDVSDGIPDHPYVPPAGDWMAGEAKKKNPTKLYRDAVPPPLGALPLAQREGITTNPEFLAMREKSWFIPRAFDYGVPQFGDSMIPESAVKYNHCIYPWREAFISFDGEVNPCCSPALFEAGHMGNLKQSATFQEVWNGPIYQRLRKSIREGRTYKFCRHCYVVNPEDPESYSLT